MSLSLLPDDENVLYFIQTIFSTYSSFESYSTKIPNEKSINNCLKVRNYWPDLVIYLFLLFDNNPMKKIEVLFPGQQTASNAWMLFSISWLKFVGNRNATIKFLFIYLEMFVSVKYEALWHFEKFVILWQKSIIKDAVKKCYLKLFVILLRKKQKNSRHFWACQTTC